MLKKKKKKKLCLTLLNRKEMQEEEREETVGGVLVATATFIKSVFQAWHYGLSKKLPVLVRRQCATPAPVHPPHTSQA
jgi:hypothetical protein